MTNTESFGHAGASLADAAAAAPADAAVSDNPVALLVTVG